MFLHYHALLRTWLVKISLFFFSGKVIPQGKQEKKAKYVQISVESYSHLTGLEDQVKTYEDQVKTYEDKLTSYEDQVQNLENEVKELNEKLSEADSEMTIKENAVKQHAKVAEEAVSGMLT